MLTINEVNLFITSLNFTRCKQYKVLMVYDYSTDKKYTRNIYSEIDQVYKLVNTNAYGYAMSELYRVMS